MAGYKLERDRRGGGRRCWVVELFPVATVGRKDATISPTGYEKTEACMGRGQVCDLCECGRLVAAEAIAECLLICAWPTLTSSLTLLPPWPCCTLHSLAPSSSSPPTEHPKTTLRCHSKLSPSRLQLCLVAFSRDTCQEQDTAGSGAMPSTRFSISPPQALTL